MMERNKASYCFSHGIALLLFSNLPLSAKIRAEPQVVELGRVTRNQTSTRSVNIINESNRDVNIGTIKGDCSCTTLSIDKKQLKPHETAILTVSVDSKTRLGDIRRNIAIETSAGLLGIPILLSVCEAKGWDLEPMPLMFLDSRASSVDNTTVILNSYDDRYIPVRVSSDSVWLTPTVTRDNTSSLVRYVIAVSRKPDAPVGLLSANIIINTNDPAAPSLTLPVHAVLHAGPFVSPNPVFLRTGSDTKVATAKVLVGGVPGSAVPSLRFEGGNAKRLSVDQQNRAEFELSVSDSAGNKPFRVDIIDNTTEIASFPVFIN